MPAGSGCPRRQRSASARPTCHCARRRPPAGNCAAARSGSVSTDAGGGPPARPGGSEPARTGADGSRPGYASAGRPASARATFGSASRRTRARSPGAAISRPVATRHCCARAHSSVPAISRPRPPARSAGASPARTGSSRTGSSWSAACGPECRPSCWCPGPAGDGACTARARRRPAARRAVTAGSCPRTGAASANAAAGGPARA